MERKNAQHYCIVVAALLAGSALLTAALLSALNGRGTLVLSVWQRVGVSAAAAAVTTGNYNGFVQAAQRFEKAPKGVLTAAALLFPVTVALITLYGMVTLAPAVAKAIVTMIRG